MNPKNILITVASVLGLGGVLTLFGMAGAWWIDQEVSNQLASAGIVPASDVVALDTRIANLEDLHDKDVNRVETKAEAIARILMEN
jgi:hypothetical protein